MRSTATREVADVPLEVDWRVAEGIEAPIGEDEMQRILEAVLEEDGVDRPCYVSVSVVGDDEIRSCNAEWRDVDAATDVISLECEYPDDPDLAEGEPCELGDIIIAPDYIARQSADFGTTPADEFRIMLVHGMLHLLGYDHIDEEDAVEMEELENVILATIPTDGDNLRIVFTRHDEDGGNA